MATIPFDELVPGATVRFTTIDGVQYLSIRDLLMHVNDKNPRRALEIWERMPTAQKEEVSAFCADYKFPGQGQQNQTVITFKGAIKVIMMLSGEKAALYRTTMVNILSRYYAGDGSLTDEIEANAASSSPVAEMARNALAGEAVLENPKKRARVDVSSFCTEVSTLLRSLETGITGQLRCIDTKQDGIYQKLYELTNELYLERERNASILQQNESMQEQMRRMQEQNESVSHSLKELSAELKARQMQIERQTCAISHLNATIRAKDAQLEKAKGVSEEVNQKLDRIVRGLNL
jgi:chromosome segregation ATPase